MASATRVYKARLRMKNKKQGRKRKIEIARKGSTPTRAVFFGDAKE